MSDLPREDHSRAPAEPRQPSVERPAQPWPVYTGRDHGAARPARWRPPPPSWPLLLAAGLVLALVAGGVGGVVGAGVSDARRPHLTVRLNSISPSGVLSRPATSVAGIAARTLPGVVYIHVRGAAEQGTGTGFVVDAKGFILTNNHVVAPAANGGSISVTFADNSTAPGRVVGRDAPDDIAVLRVDGVSGLHALALGDSDRVAVGDPVVAIGAPFGLEGTVTAGIISAKHRTVTASGGAEGDQSFLNALQTDAPINPGNSGGPLVNTQGAVIGVNAAIRSADTGPSPFGDFGQGGSIGLGFAIPINQARTAAAELISTGHVVRAKLGVALDPAFHGGARIRQATVGGITPVERDGPAARAGLRPGDVITAINGVKVTSANDLILAVRGHTPGQAVTVEFVRAGMRRRVTVLLGSAGGG